MRLLLLYFVPAVIMMLLYGYENGAGIKKRSPAEQLTGALLWPVLFVLTVFMLPLAITYVIGKKIGKRRISG